MPTSVSLHGYSSRVSGTVDKVGNVCVVEAFVKLISSLVSPLVEKTPSDRHLLKTTLKMGQQAGIEEVIMAELHSIADHILIREPVQDGSGER